jgi:hypothetical protein
MQLALRPYITTGIAIVGASVIAVAPIVPTPTEIQIPNPAVQVDRGVELTANEIEAAVNQIIFGVTSLGVRVATLPAPLLAPLLGVDTKTASTLLALGALGLAGPLISGPGAIGTAIQDVVNQLGSFDIAALINALIQAPATIIAGFVNGGFGPNIDSLGLNIGFPFFAGGLIGQLSLGNPPTLPGTFPALQALIATLLGTLGLGGATMKAAAPLAVPVQTEGAIEGAVNALVLNLIARPIVAVAGLLGQVLAPVLGEEEAAALPIAALGLLGPLVSGPGALGTAIQNVFDSLGTGNLGGILNALIGAPATLIDGVVNGGYGPNLQPLLPDLPTVLPPGLPVISVLAGGLIPNPAFSYPALLGGLGLKVGLTGATLLLPGAFPTLQKLVGQILGFLPGLAPAPAAKTSVQEMSINSVDTSNQRMFTLDVGPDLGDAGGKKTTPDDTEGKPGGTAGVSGDEKKVDTKDTKVIADLDKSGTDLTGKADDTQGGTTITTGKLDTTDGAKFQPGKKGSDVEENKKDGSNPVSPTEGTVANADDASVNSAAGPASPEGGDK